MNNFTKILKFKELKHNWDSYGAEPFTKKTINRALLFYFYLKIRYFWLGFFVAPSSDGSVNFEANVLGKQYKFEVSDSHYCSYIETEMF